MKSHWVRLHSGILLYKYKPAFSQLHVLMTSCDFTFFQALDQELLCPSKTQSALSFHIISHHLKRIGSMYAIYGNIYHQYTPNVSIYTIRGSYGKSFDIISFHDISESAACASQHYLRSRTTYSSLRSRTTYSRIFLHVGVLQNGWFIRKHPIKMDDLGVPLFQETSISRYTAQWYRILP